MKKGKSVVKRIILIIIIIIAVLFIGIVGLVVRDLTIENKLDNIVSKLSSEEEIDMTIKTTGNYAKVEKAIKTDYNDVYKLVDKIINEYENPIIEKCLSTSNYQKDGPEFINTRKELEQLKNSRKELNDKMWAIVGDESVKEKINRYQLDDYYGNLYKKYIEDLKITIREVVKEDESFNDILDSVVEILDFLTVEQKNWMVEGDHILFEDQDLLDKYNWLVSKICKDCKKEKLPNV